ncbi:MAG: hypothetical protein AB7O97_04770 [Planctomycetota bacterium]
MGAAAAFGRGNAWFAVRGADGDRVARALGLRTAVPADWSRGAAGAADGLFVAPLGRFVVAVGVDAWHRGELDAVAAALRTLSQQVGDAAWFGIDERAERFGWALARGGRLERAFCYCGDAHAVLWDEGEVTVAEDRLGFFVDDPRDQTEDPLKWWPTAADVRRLAAIWGVDPVRPPAAGGDGVLGRW